MCGLAGAFNLSRQHFPLSQELLRAMHQAISHRGPDQGTELLCDQEEIGFAFARLKIQDLSDEARQPMQDAEKTITLCFNGEIYNSAVIRRELQELGYQFSSTGDTQVLLYAYKEWGIDFLYRLEGMFAIALYDHRKKQLFLIRDRIGIKPLYFSLMGGILSWASEIKALWTLPWIEKKQSSVAAYHYLTFMVTPAPYTLFEGIYKLPAGMYLCITSDTKTPCFVQWYSPFLPLSANERAVFHDEEFCLENINALLHESVKLRMVADVPVGAFLSGGIDSSLIVALMAQHSSQIKTFTVAFEDGPETNELTWARLVAKQFGTQHHEIVISEKEAFDFYQKMLFHLDEPLADSVCVPFFFIAQLAKEQGITVAQVGEGADELFVGYDLYEQAYKASRYLNTGYARALPQSIKKCMAFCAGKISKKVSPSTILASWAQNQPLLWSGAIGFQESLKEQLFNKQKLPEFSFDSTIDAIYPGLSQGYDSSAIIQYHQKKLEAAYPEYDFFQQLLYFELKHRLPELLLMRADKMSMATSVEARVPFLDHRLVQFLMHVPAHLKYKNNTKKYLLKQICQDILPTPIIQRKKVGFSTPLHGWYKEHSAFQHYFNQLSTQKNISYLPATRYLNNPPEKATSAYAVQKWVLQTLWAQQ